MGKMSKFNKIEYKFKYISMGRLTLIDIDKLICHAIPTKIPTT